MFNNTMKRLFNNSLHLQRRIFQKLIHKKYQPFSPHEGASLQCQAASDLIKDKINSQAPCMIARFGSGELSYVVEYCNSKLGFSKYFKYVIGEIDSYRFSEQTLQTSYNNAGIFPRSQNILTKFSELMLQDMKEVDVLGSWLKQENYFTSELSNAIKVRLPDIEPYYHQYPWSACLQGKDVLVVHPFTDTIKEQYKKRAKLFDNKLILPEFNLKTIKAVQSIAGEKTSFTDWFEALDHMKNLIDQTDFDIAIIGCGAYGFPLAAHVKRMQKTSIHMGGATQLLFGIKGNRWNNHDFISQLFNEHWISPSTEETPKGHKNVEDSCYW